MPRRILVIEDDKVIGRLVDVHLKDAGHDVRVINDGKAGLEQALAKPYDLIVLGLMLPGIDGIEICRQVRAASASTLILMLTALTKMLPFRDLAVILRWYSSVS
jgi:DNA-binding response OmpR family regulator